MDTVKSKRILVGFLLLFSLWTVAAGGWQQAPLLAPLWAAGIYALWPFRVLSDRSMIVFLVVLTGIIAGMVLGPLQSTSWANHLSHMIIAALLAYATLLEFRLRATDLLVGCAVLGVVAGSGMIMELLEAGVHWNDTWNRYHDTILDLGADLAGALLGMLLGWQVSEAGLTGQDNRLDEPLDEFDT